jgi:hypothetical protein
VSNDQLGDGPGEDAFSGSAEAWEPWETKLVLLSIALGVAGLFLLGWLVDYFILP